MTPLKKTLLTVVITIILTIIILFLLVYFAWASIQTKIISILTRETRKMCEIAKPISYRFKLEVPNEPTKYSHRVSTALKDVAATVSQANCQKVTLPPPYTNYKIFKGRYGGDWKEGTMFAIGFWNPSLNHACLGFTGTYFRSEWIHDMKIGLVKCGELDNFSEGMKLHKGFYEVYLSVREEVRSWWSGLKKDNLFLTGSSMGGATSTIAAFDLIGLVRSNLVHYSFASPRCGNVTFAKRYNELLPSGFRIFNTEDLVVDIPLALGGGNYMHVGRDENLIPFTKSLSSPVENHVDAYYDLP